MKVVIKVATPRLLIALLTAMICVPAQADHTEPGEQTSWWDNTLDWLEEKRDSTTEGYLSMSKSIDEYFYGKPIEETNNRSYLKMEVKNTLYEGGEMEQDVRLRGKLDLPNTKRRVKLVFTSSADLEKSLEDRVTNDATGERVKKDDSFAGLEFTPDKKPSEWDTSLTGGIKLRTPLLPFVKYDLENNWQLGDKWRANFEQIFWYLDDDGFGETSEIRFIRPITEKDRVELSSEIEFRDKENAFFYDLILSKHRRLTNISSIEYYTGLIGETDFISEEDRLAGIHDPDNVVTSYLLGANYRKLLYKDWLFLNLEPAISFPRDEDWDPQPSFTLELQVYFSEPKTRSVAE